MKIQEIISSQKLFSKYSHKYSNPYIMYKNIIPDKIRHEFYKQATIEEIAFYFFGYIQRKPFEFPGFLVSLERHGFFKIPVTGGILTEQYWFDWYCANHAEITETSKLFCKA